MKRHGIPRDDEAVEVSAKQLFAEKGIDAGIAEIGSEEDGDTRAALSQASESSSTMSDKNWW